MARLIDADALKTKAIRCETFNLYDAPVFFKAVGTKEIDRAPTIDAVPVVRCKDCKYRFKNNGHSKDGCPIIDANIWMDDDDFCSHGERKGCDENG